MDDIEAEIFARDYKKLKYIRRGKKFKVKVVKRKGLIFKLIKYKFRAGFVLGFAMFFVMMIILPNFIWNVNISGNKNINKDEIIDALYELGIREGTPINNIDARTLPSRLKLKISDIAWAAVNIEGAVANVEITERVVANVESTTPSNLIASNDGIIVGIEVLGGSLKIKLGDTVRKGDLLVSGVSEYKNGKEYFERSYGKVICRTKDKITVRIPYEQKYTLRTDKLTTRRVLRTPFFDLPLFLLPVNYEYEKAVSTHKIELNNNYIPICVLSAEFYEIKENIIQIDQKTACSLAEKELDLKEKEMLADGKIIAKEAKITNTKDAVVIEAEYICEKNIAFEEKILIGTVN